MEPETMTRFLLAAVSAALFAATGTAQPSIATPPTLPAAPKLVLPPAPALFSDTKASSADGAPKAEAPEPSKGYTTPAAATVSVRVPTGPNTTDCGTGSVVWSESGKSYIVTNKHVVVGKRSPTELTITVNATRKTYPARFVDWSAEGDVALLEVDAELPAVVIGWNPSIGERTTHYGNTTGPQVGTVRGFEETSTSGNGTHPWAGWIMRGTHVGASGDSGAGVFNDKGELVAVLWGGQPGDAHAAPAYVVRRLLARAVANRLPRLASRLNIGTDAAVTVVAPPTAPTPKSAAPKLADSPECVCPLCKCQPCTGACAKTATAAQAKWDVRDRDGRIYRGLTAEQARARFPGVTFPGDAGHVGWTENAVSGTSFHYAPSFGSPCANGRCPQQR